MGKRRPAERRRPFSVVVRFREDIHRSRRMIFDMAGHHRREWDRSYPIGLDLPRSFGIAQESRSRKSVKQWVDLLQLTASSGKRTSTRQLTRSPIQG